MLNFNSKTLDDLAAKIGKAVEASPAKDIEKNVRSLMGAAFTKMDLVTREEFDVQQEVLARTREQLAERKTIEKAKGLIMRQRGVSENEAYQALRKTAMRTNSRIADVAERLIISAELLF